MNVYFKGILGVLGTLSLFSWAQAQQLDMEHRALKTMGGTFSDQSGNSQDRVHDLAVSNRKPFSAAAGVYQGTLFDQEGRTLTRSNLADQQGAFIFLNPTVGSQSPLWVSSLIGLEDDRGFIGSSSVEGVYLANFSTTSSALGIYSTGWYRDTVNFGQGYSFGDERTRQAQGNHSKDVFILKHAYNPNRIADQSIVWDKAFRSMDSGPGEDIAHDIQVSDGFMDNPSLIDLEPALGPGTTRPRMGLVAICGEFGGKINVTPDESEATVFKTSGAQDGFVSLLSVDHGAYYDFVKIGLGGQDCAQALVFGRDPLTNKRVLYVTGFITIEQNRITLDRSVIPGGFGIGAYTERELFVAKFRIDESPDEFPQRAKLLQEWFYLSGIKGHDSGTAIHADARGNIYVVGAKESSPNNRDILFIKLRDLGRDQYQEVFRKTIGSFGDEFAEGVTQDYLGHILICGSFGLRSRTGPATGSYTLDFNPDPLQSDRKTAQGGLDCFISRYRDDGTYQGTYVMGSDWDETSSGGIQAHYSGSVFHAGGFGAVNAPSNYSVDFDVRTQDNDFGVSRGKEDGYVNRFEPAQFQNVQIQLSLVTDVSGSVGAESYESMMAAYARLVQDPHTVPQDGSVAINVVQFGADAVEAFPWTVLTPYSAPLVGQALLQLPIRVNSVGATAIGRGMDTSEASFLALPLRASHRVMNVVADGADNANQPYPNSVRDRVLSEGLVDCINGIAVEESTLRDYFLQNVIGPAGNSFALFSFGYEIDFECKQRNKFLREIHYNSPGCWADYNGDGQVNNADLAAFQADWVALEPCADFDGNGVVDGADLSEFIEKLSLGCSP